MFDSRVWASSTNIFGLSLPLEFGISLSTDSSPEGFECIKSALDPVCFFRIHIFSGWFSRWLFTIVNEHLLTNKKDIIKAIMSKSQL